MDAPRPLTQKESRIYERLQLKWGRGTITTEEKAYALALSARAWEADRAATLEQHIKDVNAKTNAAMSPSQRAASDRVRSAVASHE